MIKVLFILISIYSASCLSVFITATPLGQGKITVNGGREVTTSYMLDENFTFDQCRNTTCAAGFFFVNKINEKYLTVSAPYGGLLANNVNDSAAFKKAWENKNLPIQASIPSVLPPEAFNQPLYFGFFFLKQDTYAKGVEAFEMGPNPKIISQRVEQCILITGGGDIDFGKMNINTSRTLSKEIITRANYCKKLKITLRPPLKDKDRVPAGLSISYAINGKTLDVNTSVTLDEPQSSENISATMTINDDAVAKGYSIPIVIVIEPS